MKKFIWRLKINKIKTQQIPSDSGAVNLLLGLSLLALVLSAFAQIINHTVYHFSGNNYFPPFSSFAFGVLFLSCMGSRILFGKKDIKTKTIQQTLFFFFIMGTIAFATNSVQYTPFPLVDEKIIKCHGILAQWLPTLFSLTKTYPTLEKILNWSYVSLDYQMAFLPLLMISTKQYQVLYQYYKYLLLTLILGFLCYYFFPTIAPASVFKLPCFTQSQYATGIKFIEIHTHLKPSTLEGGLIALPSFHVIWAVLCVGLVRNIPVLFYPLLINNFFLIAACVLLGWHYPLDVVASFFLLWLSFSLSRWLSKLASRQPAVANCDSEIIMARR